MRPITRLAIRSTPSKLASSNAGMSENRQPWLKEGSTVAPDLWPLWVWTIRDPTMSLPRVS